MPHGYVQCDVASRCGVLLHVPPSHPTLAGSEPQPLIGVRSQLRSPQTNSREDSSQPWATVTDVRLPPPMDRKLIPIQPAPPRPPPGATGPPEETQLPRRRQSARIACNPCRARKGAVSCLDTSSLLRRQTDDAKCDGARPACTPCRKKRIECVYRKARRADEEEMRQRLREHDELLGRLRSLPEHEALNLLQSLRRASDPARALASAEGSMHSRQRPSDLLAAKAIFPPTSSNVEFELMASHAPAYPQISPQNISFLEQFLAPTFLTGTAMPVPGPSQSSSYTFPGVPAVRANSPMSSALPRTPRLEALIPPVAAGPFVRPRCATISCTSCALTTGPKCPSPTNTPPW